MRDEKGSKDYVIRVVDHPSLVDAAPWNALLGAQPSAPPFMRHEYRLALHESGTSIDDTGWQPQCLLIHDGDTLTAACPLYLKTHSYGEYVFDWAWADAYQRHGLRYYPKLLVAVPFTPVPGTRLMAVDDEARAALVSALHALAHDAGLSSAHVLFHDESDARALQHAGWFARHNVQFHWTREAAGSPDDFGQFLARMQHDKRKKINQERRKVADAGVVFTVHEGAQIDEGLWDFFHRCY